MSAGTPEPDQEELLRMALAGDEGSFGKLLSAHARYLSLLARLRIGRDLQGKADPDDLVQEAFVEAIRQLPQFRGRTIAEFLAWLRQILAGRLAALARKYLGIQARDVKLERQISADLDQSSFVLAKALISPISSPSGQAARHEQAVLLAEALAALPEHYREVLVLRHLEGLSFAEVSHRMQRSEDSVQKLWVRGLAQLRRSFGKKP